MLKLLYKTLELILIFTNWISKLKTTEIEYNAKVDRC